MNGVENAHRKPVLGVSTYLQRAQSGVWDVQAAFLPAQYLHAVTTAGAVGVLLPPQPLDDGVIEQVLDGIDGLIITGGRDVDPCSYGHARHARTDQPATERDAWEFGLLRGALARALPVLGICRGAQVLNVALGGTLHQHLPDVVGHSGHRVADAVFSRVIVQTTPSTRLAALLGESASVQCYHHQAIDALGLDVVVSARGSDGVIEAIELVGSGFCLGVQWHPEQSVDDLRLFVGVVEAARNRIRDKVRT